MNEKIIALWRLVLKNISKWRWRFLLISILIATALSLFMAYGGLSSDNQRDALSLIEPINSSFFDLLLILDGEQIFNEDHSLPADVQDRTRNERAIYIDLNSSYGALSLLGLNMQEDRKSLERSLLTGSLPVGDSDIVLPQSWAEQNDLKLGDRISLLYREGNRRVAWEASVCGICSDNTSFNLAITSLAALLSCRDAANALLIDMISSEITLAQLSDSLRSLYPQAIQFSTYLPQFLGENLLDQIYRPSTSLLILIFLFSGIGILTVALTTFMERRRELATLKIIGMSNRQTFIVLGMEYALSELLGLALAFIFGFVMLITIPWVRAIDQATLFHMLLRGFLLTLLLLVIALIYPMTLARVATAEQLLQARTIPLSTRWYDHMTPLQATEDLCRREIMDNIRIMKIPFEPGIDKYDCMVFIEKNRHVKKGEVIASQELYQGHIINNFCSPCDGIILDILASLVLIKPDRPNEESFYPYVSAPKIDRSIIAQRREQDRLDHHYSFIPGKQR